VTIDPTITTINADEDKFLRIMINLISNAVKFTPSGGHIDVMVARDGDQGVYVTVSDTGIGIPSDYLESIFQPFKQVEGAAGGQPGTGLGLAVVKQLVELHGGRVWVESALGVGTSFHVVLPNALSPALDLPVSEETPPVLPVEQTPAPVPESYARGLVLVVEDTEDHMAVMRLAVTSRGYTMHGVVSGEEALAWLADHHPDVILLDMQLPGIDGFSVAARIKSQVETHSIPVIAVTADALAAHEERAKASGVDAYLTKPIDIARLLEAIDTVTA
jgi:CheY-like chemotaxis protein